MRIINDYLYLRPDPLEGHVVKMLVLNAGSETISVNIHPLSLLGNDIKPRRNI